MSQDETSYLRMDGFWQRGDRVFDGWKELTPFVSRLGRMAVQIDPEHERELKEHSGQLATHETWLKYSKVGNVAALWRAIALLCCADPADWSLEQMVQVSFCRWRLDMAIVELGRTPSLLKTFDENPNLANRIVRFDRVRNWCQKTMLPVPWFYPDCWHRQVDYDEAAKPAPNERDADAPLDENETASSEGDTAPPPKPARRSRLAKPSTAFLREAELLSVVPFSRATLWRKVRAGTFPAPIKLSVGVTVWPREPVDEWLALHSLPKDVAPRLRTAR